MELPGWISKGIRIPRLARGGQLAALERRLADLLADRGQFLWNDHPSAKWDIILLLALFLSNFLIFSSWTDLGDLATKPWLLLVWLYGFIGLLSLAWRDEAPLIVFITQWVHAVTAAALPFIRDEYTPVAGIPLALYAVSVHYSRKTSLLALLAALIASDLGTTITYFVNDYRTPDEAIKALISNGVFLALVAGGAGATGRATRARQMHVWQLEREREGAREEKMLTEERRRIAQELHDIVSHSVTVILFQANGAACIADTKFTEITNTEFSQIKQSLENIATTSTQTMAELKRLLEVLEVGEVTRNAVGSSELRPQPGLADLTTALLDPLRAIGMQVTEHIEGRPRDLDPGVDLTAYRIVQEGLTNVLKHAGKDANPHMRLVWESQNLRIQIDNDANSAEVSRTSALSVGRGLVGLRARVRAVGGNLEAGPHHNGGYRLTATIPFSTPENLMSGPSSRPQEDQGKVSA